MNFFQTSVSLFNQSSPQITSNSSENKPIQYLQATHTHTHTRFGVTQLMVGLFKRKVDVVLTNIHSLVCNYVFHQAAVFWRTNQL